MSHENPGDNKRCDWCDRLGQPYEYRGQTFSGLTACEGGRLCPTCRDSYLDQKINEPVGPMQMPAAAYVVPRRDPGNRPNPATRARLGHTEYASH